MAAGAGDEGPQLSELESLQLKANKVTDESLESTRRMITLCEEVGDPKFFKNTLGGGLLKNTLSCFCATSKVKGGWN